jgi:predicted transcriptional regulator
MNMRPPCETIVSYVLPAIRACIVTELKDKHKLKQVEMAKRLKISQSAISQYTTQTRGSKCPLEKYKDEIDEDLKDLAAMVAKNEKEELLVDKLCSICKTLQKMHFNEIFCELKKVSYE